MNLAASSRSSRAVFAVCSILLGACGADAAGASGSTGSDDPALTSATASNNGEQAEAEGVAPASGASGSVGGTPGGTTATVMPYRGVNLNGADFGSALPGTFNRDYTFPTTSEVDYYLGKGMTTFRIGFVWERLQPAAYGAFDTTYANRLYSLVSYAEAKGAHV